MCPEVDSPGISPWVKAAGAFGWQPTTLVVPKVEKIRGLNLPGSPRDTSACCGIPLLYIYICVCVCVCVCTHVRPSHEPLTNYVALLWGDVGQSSLTPQPQAMNPKPVTVKSHRLEHKTARWICRQMPNALLTSASVFERAIYFWLNSVLGWQLLHLVCWAGDLNTGCGITEGRLESERDAN